MVRPQYILGLAVRDEELGACIVSCETGRELAAFTGSSRAEFTAWLSQEFCKYRSMCIVMDAATCICHARDELGAKFLPGGRFMVNERPRFPCDVYTAVMREASAAKHLGLIEAVSLASVIVQSHNTPDTPPDNGEDIVSAEAKRVAVLTVRCIKHLRSGKLMADEDNEP